MVRRSETDQSSTKKKLRSLVVVVSENVTMLCLLSPLSELFTTEHAHVRKLSVLQMVFSKPLEREELLTATELATIFPNLDEIIEMHCKFCCKNGPVFMSSQSQIHETNALLNIV